MSILFNSDDDSIDFGPDEIIEAVYTNESIYEVDEAVCGLPRLEDFGDGVFTDLYVVIPLNVTADVDLSPLLYDIPESPTLDGKLGELASFYGIEEIEDIANFQGEVVPLVWIDGYPQPEFNQLRSAQNRGEV